MEAMEAMEPMDWVDSRRYFGPLLRVSENLIRTGWFGRNSLNSLFGFGGSEKMCGSETRLFGGSEKWVVRKLDFSAVRKNGVVRKLDFSAVRIFEVVRKFDFLVVRSCVAFRKCKSSVAVIFKSSWANSINRSRQPSTHVAKQVSSEPPGPNSVFIDSKYGPNTRSRIQHMHATRTCAVMFQHAQSQEPRHLRIPWIQCKHVRIARTKARLR